MLSGTTGGKTSRRRTSLKAALRAALGLALAAALSAEVRPAAGTGLDPVRLGGFVGDLERLRLELKIPGLSAAIVKDGAVAWAQGFGFADLELRKPATKDTPYGIASLTKTLSSTLILRLVEEGRLSLDDPVSRYAPSFRDGAVRVKHVLSHTSDGRPGDAYAYNSDRFGLLAELIRNVSGTPFRALLASTILEPLGMMSTIPGMDFDAAEARGETRLGRGTRGRYRWVLARTARPYLLYGADEVVRAPFPAPQIDAASGIISTVMDLAKFDGALDDHRWLSREMQDRAWTPFVSNAGEPLPYGLGWFVEDLFGQRLVWHYGDLPDSFSSLYLKAPGKRLTLILLANSDGLSAPFFAAPAVETSAFAASFLRRFVLDDAPPGWQAPAEDAIGRWLEDKRSARRVPVAVDARDLRPCAGRYRLRPKGILTVTCEKGALWIDMPQDIKSRLFPAGRDRFFLKTMTMDITFVRGGRNEVTGIRFSANGATVAAERIGAAPGAGAEGRVP
jgi:CubicO group peptidase (beta-lactamase class C family)